MNSSKLNVVVFASDAKHTSYLNSIILQGWNEVNLFYMVCSETQLKHPAVNPEVFDIGHNVVNPEPVKSHTLNQTLPFKPDWLIVSRERWDPESSIINEFKNKLGAKIALVEPNSAMISSVNQFLESESKNRFANSIDVFFDHSNFIKEQRKLLGFKGNIVVTGNPKYDINLDLEESAVQALKDYYNIDPNKKQVLLFTLQNKYRYKLFQQFKQFKEQHPEYQYFIKPYPGEPFDPLFTKEYFPKFFMDGVTPILNETHIWGMYSICDIHLGCLSSVMYPSFFLNKEIHEYSKEIGAQEGLDLNKDIINGSSGHEDKLEIWLNTFNIDLEQFKELTSSRNLQPKLKNNNKIWKALKNVLSYREDILKMYDQYNDKQASKRIIDYIKSYEV